jgi:hypothetical protein
MVFNAVDTPLAKLDTDFDAAPGTAPVAETAAGRTIFDAVTTLVPAIFGPTKFWLGDVGEVPVDADLHPPCLVKLASKEPLVLPAPTTTEEDDKPLPNPLLVPPPEPPALPPIEAKGVPLSAGSDDSMVIPR